MSAINPPPYAVITADVIGSRKWPRFTAIRNRKLDAASAAHQKQRIVLGPYTITTWDEFQNIAAGLRHVPGLIFDLRRLCHPLQLRIGVGLGKVDRPIRRPINRQQAFILAREALDKLKGGRAEKFARTTYVRCAVAPLQDLANLFFGLQDSLTGGISPRQWDTINALMAAPNQEIAAHKLGVNKSTVSRNLRRAHYWEIQASIEAMGSLAVTLHENVQLNNT